MRYIERFIKDPLTAVMVKDRSCEGKLTVSRTVTKDECRKIRPEEPPRIFNIVFKRGGAVKVDLDIAQFLLKKYPSIYVIDPMTGNEEDMKDDLTDLAYNVLIQLLSKYNAAAEVMGIDRVPATGKKENVQRWIRNFRRMGVVLTDPHKEEIQDTIDEEDQDEV